MPQFTVLRTPVQLLMDNGGLTIFYDLNKAKDAAREICARERYAIEVLQVVARFEPHAHEVPVE